jgi:hypothetical protein
MGEDADEVDVQEGEPAERWQVPATVKWAALAAVIAAVATTVVLAPWSDGQRAAVSVRSGDDATASTTTTEPSTTIPEVVTTVEAVATTGSVPRSTVTSPHLPPPPPTSPSTTAPPPALVPLAQQCAAEGSPKPAGTGQNVVGILKADGVHEISPDGTVDYKVPGTDGQSSDVTWSRDGRFVAWVKREPDLRTKNGAPPSNLVVAEIATGCWTQLSGQSADRYERPSLSTDGSRVAFVRIVDGSSRQGNVRLEVASRQGGQVRFVADDSYEVAWPADARERGRRR